MRMDRTELWLVMMEKTRVCDGVRRERVGSGIGGNDLKWFDRQTDSRVPHMGRRFGCGSDSMLLIPPDQVMTCMQL